LALSKTPRDLYGVDATIHSAMRADELLAHGDQDGTATWRRALIAVKELERTEPYGAAFVQRLDLQFVSPSVSRGHSEI